MVEDEGFSFERLDGRTPVKKRHDMIQRFNEDSSIDLMLITTRTGGLGISLTGANRVVIIDPDWNPQTDVQVDRRAYVTSELILCLVGA
jgi:DNA excision repair protein ERCC-6